MPQLIPLLHDYDYARFHPVNGSVRNGPCAVSHVHGSHRRGRVSSVCVACQECWWSGFVGACQNVGIVRRLAQRRLNARDAVLFLPSYSFCESRV